MPDTTTTINRDQRDGLYEVIHNHLSLVQDFWVAMQRTEDGATAERLGLEFAEDFRLLQDIGWGEKDERETFDLTMPEHDLMELLQHLQGEAVTAPDQADTARGVLSSAARSSRPPCLRPTCAVGSSAPCADAASHGAED